MIIFAACPRCGGPVLDYGCQVADSPLCIMCGWRRRDIPPAIQAEVKAHLGKGFLQDRYTHKRVGGGKPPLSGWEREKRRRERERQRESQRAS